MNVLAPEASQRGPTRVPGGHQHTTRRRYTCGDLSRSGRFQVARAAVLRVADGFSASKSSLNLRSRDAPS